MIRPVILVSHSTLRHSRRKEHEHAESDRVRLRVNDPDQRLAGAPCFLTQPAKVLEAFLSRLGSVLGSQ